MVLISILYFVNLLASFTLLPFLPIANDKFSSSTIAKHSCLFSSKILTMTPLAGLKAFLINSAASGLYFIKSTRSPFSSFNIAPILHPFSPMQAPIGSIFSFVEYTATLLLNPGSRATEYKTIVPSANSGI